MPFRNEEDISKVAEESGSFLISCDSYRRYKVEWDHEDDFSVLTIYVYYGYRNQTLLRARFNETTELRHIAVCDVDDLKYPLITSKLII